MALAMAIQHAQPIVLILDAYFAVAPVFALAASLWSMAHQVPWVTLIVRAKNNYVAYFPPPVPQAHTRGRPRRYGDKIALMEVSLPEMILYLLVDPLLLMGGLWLVMTLFGRRERWPQTVSAVLGCSALMALAVSVPMMLLLGPRMAGEPSVAVQLLALGLVGIALRRRRSP